MTWRVAESLETLRKQLNAAFPKRSKAADGGIGDAAHASRGSDHNPYVKDKSGIGVVRARDFTHDPQTGIDCNWLAEQLVESRDPRINYLIWNKRICSRTVSPWRWRPYTGKNGHTKHLHISVSEDAKLYDSTKEWALDFPNDDEPEVKKTVSEKPVEEIDPPAGNVPAPDSIGRQKALSEFSDESDFRDIADDLPDPPKSQYIPTPAIDDNGNPATQSPATEGTTGKEEPPAPPPVEVKAATIAWGERIGAMVPIGGGVVAAILNGLSNPYVLAFLALCAVLGFLMWRDAQKDKQKRNERYFANAQNPATPDITVVN